MSRRRHFTISQSGLRISEKIFRFFAANKRRRPASSKPIYSGWGGGK